MEMSQVQIGQKVKFVGDSVTAECIGTVIELYPPDMFDEEDYPGAVSMKPDVLPDGWVYDGYDVFAPWVNELVLVPA